MLGPKYGLGFRVTNMLPEGTQNYHNVHKISKDRHGLPKDSQGFPRILDNGSGPQKTILIKDLSFAPNPIK